MSDMQELTPKVTKNMTNTLYAADAGAPGQMLSNANFSVSNSKRKGTIHQSSSRGMRVD